MNPPLTLGQCAALACLLEASAAKPGNVHRAADFEDVTFVDFATSAVAIAPVFDAAPNRRVGETVMAAVSATRQLVGTNTNLGMLLLLAPLAHVPNGEPLREGVRRVLAALDATDCRLVYEAIRLAQPGGLGTAPEADVAGAAPGDLLAAMRLAADRDLVARQYVNDYAEVFERVVPGIAAGLKAGWGLSDAIVHTYVALLRDRPDTLIARKCGPAVAEEAASYAAVVLRAGGPGDEAYADALADLDFWLRADGHRRNPGTTADLIAAGLFAALRSNMIQWPIRFYNATGSG